MTSFFLESGKNREARLKLEKKVGARPFFDPLFRFSSGKGKGRYASIDSKEREAIARTTYKNLDDNVKAVLITYEIKYTNVLAGRTKLQFKDKQMCAVCGRPNEGAYDICPVCLETYHGDFRSEFLLTLNS